MVAITKSHSATGQPFSLPDGQLPHSHRFANLRTAREVGIIVAAFIAYFLIRGFTEADFLAASANSDRVLALEQALHLDFEAPIQRLIIDSSTLTTAVNWMYIWGHWPVITAVAIWLLLKHHGEYRKVRNVFLISGGIGLIIFATFPVAPPRLVEFELVDTVTVHSTSYRVLQPQAFVNQYAAVPSLHFGWDLIIGIFLFRVSSHIWMKVAGVALPIAMAFAVIATANHYVLDVIAGGVLATSSLLFVLWRDRRSLQPHKTTQEVSV